MNKPLARKPCKDCGSRIAGGLGYCNKHYIQFRKYGRTFTKEEMKSHYKVNSNTGRTHFKKGHEPWSKGKGNPSAKGNSYAKGITPWNKGIKWARMAKENNPAWKGGVRSENDKDRARFRKQYQQLVFERDNYTCQICDVYGASIQVDHIKRWSEYPDLRFNLDNCRTLCMACHYYVTFKRKIPAGIIWGHNLSKRKTS